MADQARGLQFKARWRAFWHVANQLQFLPGFSMATRSAVTSGELDGLWTAWQAQAASTESASSESRASAWAQAHELSMLEPDQLRALAELGLPDPEIGVDLTSGDGEVVAGVAPDLASDSGG